MFFEEAKASAVLIGHKKSSEHLMSVGQTCFPQGTIQYMGVHIFGTQQMRFINPCFVVRRAFGTIIAANCVT